MARHTLAEILVRYGEAITPMKRGSGPEKYRIKTLLAHRIARCTLDRLTSSEVASYRDDRLRMVSEPTVRRELVVLRHAIETAKREWGYPFPTNPVSGIKIPQHGTPRTRRLTEEEFETLMQAAAKAKTWYLFPIIALAIETGMRRSEILSLRWQNIDERRAVALLPFTKNGESRLVPLSTKARSTLNIVKGRHDTLVFPISENAFRLSWERIVRKLRFHDLHFHDLRHEAISRFFEKGLSLPEVALISGHKDPRMLFRYTHLRAEIVAARLD